MIGRFLKNRFLSDRPVLTLTELAIASVFVGAALAFFRVSPIMVWRYVAEGVADFVSLIAGSASEVITTILGYLALGAAIVVPIYILIRIFVRPRKQDDV